MNKWIGTFEQLAHEEYYRIDVTSTFMSNGMIFVNNKYVMPISLQAKDGKIIATYIRKNSIILKGQYQDSVRVVNHYDTTAFRFHSMEEWSQSQ
jgi:hypothetical protein